MSEKSEKPREHKRYLGAAVKSGGANGNSADARFIRTIAHPDHSLHRRGLFEPARYELKNPSVQALVKFCRAGIFPAPILLRINGTYKHDDPVYRQMVQEGLPVRDEEPILETVFGNTRTEACRWANTQRQADGQRPDRALFTYQDMDDDEAELRFRQENWVRQANSPWQNYLAVRAARAREEDWQEIAEDMGLPPVEVQRVFDPLLLCEEPIVRAYFDNTISLTQTTSSSASG
jgi:hypothetical protein